MAVSNLTNFFYFYLFIIRSVIFFKNYFYDLEI